MRRWLGLVLFALLGVSAAWAAQDGWALKRVFGAKNIGMVQTGRQAVIEYCPDDSCSRFVLAGDHSLSVLHDFVFLYLALVQNYDVEQVKAPGGERYFEMVMKRQRGSCAGPDETAVAKCTLAGMARRYPVLGYVSKMDDGWRRSEPFDLRAAVTRAGIF